MSLVCFCRDVFLFPLYVFSVASGFRHSGLVCC